MKHITLIFFTLLLLVSCGEEEGPRFYELEREVLFNDSFDNDFNWKFTDVSYYPNDSTFAGVKNNNLILYSDNPGINATINLAEYAANEEIYIEAGIISFESVMIENEVEVASAGIFIGVGNRIYYHDNERSSLSLSNNVIHMKINFNDYDFTIYRENEDITSDFAFTRTEINNNSYLSFGVSPANGNDVILELDYFKVYITN